MRTLRTFFRILYRWWHLSSNISTILQASNVRGNNRDFRNHALSQDSSKQPGSSGSSLVSIVLSILRPSNLLIPSYSNFYDVRKTSDLLETDVRTFIASASRIGSRWSVALSRRDRYQSGKAGHLAPISLNRIFNPVLLSACRVVYCLTCIQLDCTIRGTLMHDKLAIYLPVHGFTCIRAPRNHLPATMELSYFGYSRGWLAWTQRAFLVSGVPAQPGGQAFRVQCFSPLSIFSFTLCDSYRIMRFRPALFLCFILSLLEVQVLDEDRIQVEYGITVTARYGASLCTIAAIQ